MNTDNTYLIPIEGLKAGKYVYTFELGKDFFESKDYADFSASVTIKLVLIKHADTMELQFNIKGVVYTQCDRCMRDIELPIDTEHSLLVKYGVEEDKGDIAYIPKGTTEIDLSHYLFEFTGLSIPMQHVCADTERGECPEKVREILDKKPDKPENKEKPDVWEALEDLSFDD